MEEYKVKSDNRILNAFEIYKNTVFTTDTDLSFWKSFLQTSINNYKANNPTQVGLYEAGFYVYEYSSKHEDGHLKGHKISRLIKTDNLEIDKNDFISWISNLATLKIYNALENFILQAIHIRYFMENKHAVGSKKATDKLNIDIKTYLLNHNLKVDTKNNRHIIQFLRSKSSNVTSFLERKMNIDLATKWGDFFELISILRNVIAHQGTIVSSDTQNEIKSRAKDIFQRHFSLNKDEFGLKRLQPNNEQYASFINYFNSFSLHVVQCIFDEDDLKFLGMN
ncbi:hypothetical protein SAMN04488511_11689 [Pedobacter suwonensis]|uniref:Uncharacterized protein n=1 Tax=Pedobacter suwonensis TaxID=332999 RepID=A0A1I0TY50_9SPHI|nr:hypothetical protein [Pedobacter suwonensis]SFA56702.1 hypothetical protein SAMN04488511_11689 [Pedobacter suwonensis]